MSKYTHVTMRNLRTIVIIITIIAVSACFTACPKKRGEGKEHTPFLKKITRKAFSPSKSEKPKCPTDMAYVEPAKICMDIYEYPNVSGEMPLSGVTHAQAVELCKKRGKVLPTAKEWTLACGGLDENPYPYGEKFDKDACRVDKDYSAGPEKSGSMPKCKSMFGIYDMSGNLWEWTSSEGFDKGTFYVKGGSWRSWSSVATCGLKAWEPPDGGGNDYGFRCALKP